MRTPRGPVLLLFGVAFGAALSSAASAWTPAWETTIASTARTSELRGVCETGGVVYVLAMASEKIAEPIPILYAIRVDSGATAPAAKTLWKGQRARRAEEMTNPLCDSTGVSFVLREDKGKPEVVRLDFAGKVLERNPVAIENFYSAEKWAAIGKDRKVLADNRRLFIVDPKGNATELPIPGLDDHETILDLCAFQEGRGFALLTMSLAGPAAQLRLRRFDAKPQMTESRAIPGGFGGVSCSPPGDEIQLAYLDAAAGTISLARFGPKLASKPAEPLVAASVASLGARGLNGRDSTFWTFNSGMRSRVYEVPGKAAPTLAWAEPDVQRWGTTVNAPAGVMIGGDAILLVMEGIDRSAGGPKVLRVLRLAR